MSLEKRPLSIQFCFGENFLYTIQLHENEDPLAKAFDFCLKNKFCFEDAEKISHLIVKAKTHYFE